MSSKKIEKKAPAPQLTLEKLQERLDALEIAWCLSAKEVTAPVVNIPSSVDITLIMEQRNKSPLLQSIYPLNNGQPVLNFDDSELTEICSGYWPTPRNWQGMYLGGCELCNESRRSFTIPLFVKNSIDFFTPQGLAINKEDVLKRVDALNSCGAALIDFTGDELCLNYTAGIDFMYLFGTGFTNVVLISLPASPAAGSMRFDNEQKYANVYGPYDAVSLRSRRFEYYSILRTLLKLFYNKTEVATQEFPTLLGAKGFEQDLINLRANYKTPRHSDGIAITVLDRVAVYRQLKEMSYGTDIGCIMRICFGIIVLCDMQTREFMDANMPEWRLLRGEFQTLCRELEYETALMSEDKAEKHDGHFHISACAELVHYLKVLVASKLYLN